MKAVIPAKLSSTRVPMKNYRCFLNGKSLVDILVEKLLRILPASDIYLSCEDSYAETVALRDGIQFQLRDKRLTDNDTPLAEVVRGITAAIPGDDPVMWCEAIDPLFDEHATLLRMWEEVKLNGHDSAVVVYPEHGYLLAENLQPIGWGFGPWHVSSQKLPSHFRVNFCCSILTRKCIAECGYMIGKKPWWFTARGPFIDIDTEDDFRLAQVVYAASIGEPTIP